VLLVVYDLTANVSLERGEKAGVEPPDLGERGFGISFDAPKPLSTFLSILYHTIYIRLS
jgi:hypothetical protein